MLGLARKLSQTKKSFPLTVKYQGLKCKIVYTSISLSNHLCLFSASTQRESEKEKKKRKRKVMPVIDSNYITNNKLLPKICDENTVKML